MVSRIEAAFRQKKVWTWSELAAYVGVSPELLAAGVEQLKRMGRLSEDAQGQLERCVNPTHQCDRCAFQGLCQEDQTARARGAVARRYELRPGRAAVKPGQRPAASIRRPRRTSTN
ncbi:MAG: hypothetical protein IRZ33_09595 [Alicyclobacillaceae bacterium]|nr:hypothetical protein [Alicyclobacillaceae bacterium]